MVSSIPHDYTKRLMVFGGRASMELAAKIAGKLDVDLGQVDLRTFADGEVYCRYEESIRGADVFLVQSTAANARPGDDAERRADGAAGDDRRRPGRLGAPDHRRHALVRLRAPGQEVAPREPITARVVAKCLEAVGVDRVLTMDLHSGQVQGFFAGPRRPHDRDADADPVLHGPGLGRRARDRLARRRPGQGGAQLRPQGRRPLGGDGEGAPRPAGRRDRLRGRRRRAARPRSSSTT